MWRNAENETKTETGGEEGDERQTDRQTDRQRLNKNTFFGCSKQERSDASSHQRIARQMAKVAARRGELTQERKRGPGGVELAGKYFQTNEVDA